jgi:hypothetical protein
VTAPDAVASVPGPVTGTVVGQAGSEVCVRLDVSEWRIRWRLQPDGRTVIEVCDETGVLTGLVVGTRLPRPAVTFTRRCPAAAARRTTVRPATTGGLWVAVVTGRYTTVCCQLTSPEPVHLTAAAQLACRLAPVTARHARR